jgi:glycerol kinase
VASRHRLLTTVAWKMGGRTDYALEGSVFSGGAVVQWLRDGLGLIRSADEIEALAASVPDSAGVFLVPAFAGLGAPHWDPYARGALVGLTRHHGPRAGCAEAPPPGADLPTRRRLGCSRTELRVDGAARNNLRMQFQADGVRRPPRHIETTALVRVLAGLAVGV